MKKTILALGLTALLSTPALAAGEFAMNGTHLEFTVPDGCEWKENDGLHCLNSAEEDVAFLNFSTWSVPNDQVRDQSGLKAIFEDPRRKANLLRSFHARLLDDRKSDKSNGFKQGDAPTEVLLQTKQGVWALVGSRVIVNNHGVGFRNDELEIWDGGQRVNIVFASRISGDNPAHDPNFAFVTSIIDSLAFNVTEGSPLNDLPAPTAASVDAKAMRF